MDEIARTQARNYLSASGFFLIAAHFLLLVFGEPNASIQVISGLGLLLVATLLIVLRKRDMVAILFMMIAFSFSAIGFISGETGFIIPSFFGGLNLLTLLITFTGKDKAKWMLIFLSLAMLMVSLAETLNGKMMVDLYCIPVIVALYFALVCASERIDLPGRKLLTADEETDFKASGSVLGYLLFAVISGIYVVYYIVGEDMLHLEYPHTINLAAAVLLVFIAVLLFAVAKMRFTPVMFLLLGLTELLAMFSTGTMFIGTGILFIIIGLFAMLRKESRILPGIMLIVYGCGDFFFAYEAGNNAPVASLILNIIPCAIAVYLSFVVYSQKKLPKFRSAKTHAA